MSRVNFTYEMAAKIAELVDEHTCGDWPPQGYDKWTKGLLRSVVN